MTPGGGPCLSGSCDLRHRAVLWKQKDLRNLVIQFFTKHHECFVTTSAQEKKKIVTRITQIHMNLLTKSSIVAIISVVLDMKDNN
jgi:hypothetical protein